MPGKKSEKGRETLKERCKSHEVSQTRACEHYLCIAPPPADGFANNTGGLGGEGIQFKHYKTWRK